MQMEKSNFLLSSSLVSARHKKHETCGERSLPHRTVCQVPYGHAECLSWALSAKPEKIYKNLYLLLSLSLSLFRC